MKIFTELITERFENRLLEVQESLNEISLLLNNDQEQINEFFVYFSISCWGSNPKKLKLDQDELRKAKNINEKIAKKSYELYELLNELESIESYDVNWPIFSLGELIKDAESLSYKLDPVKKRATRQRWLYKKVLGKTIEKINKLDESLEYFPSVKYVLYALNNQSKLHSFRNPIERQTSPRAAIRFFLRELVSCVEHNIFSEKILSISHASVADLFNVALDLTDDELISSDNVRKVFNEIIKSNGDGQLA